jgi:hypothetical protein
VFVRVKLDEAMSLTDNKWRPGKDDWKAHTPSKDDATAMADMVNCGHGVSDGLFHSYFTWEMGGQKWYMPSDGTKQVVQDTANYTKDTPGAKETPFASLISAKAFLDLYKTDEAAALGFVGWIYDTDGYAYWSKPLLKGDATGLLLHKVVTAEALKDKEYYYAINVVLEAIDQADVPMWKEGAPSADNSGKTHPIATPDGKDVIDIIVGQDKGVKINGTGEKTMYVGETYEPGYEKGHGVDGTAEWSGSDPSVATVSPDGTITGVSPGTATITLKIGDFTDTLVVTVVEQGGGGKSLPVVDSPSGFMPRTDDNPENGNAYYAQINFRKPTDMESNRLFHEGSIWLEDIITDGNYDGVVAESMDAKYAGDITVGNDRHGKASVMYSYRPVNQELADWQAAYGTQGFEIKVPVKLTRGGESAVVTIVMYYGGCMVTLL